MASQERKRKNSAPVLTSKKVSKTSAIAKPGSSERDDSSEFDLILSQSDTNSCSQPNNIGLSCGVCKQPVSMNTIQVTSLQCCLCKVNYCNRGCWPLCGPPGVAATVLVDARFQGTNVRGFDYPSCRQSPCGPRRQFDSGGFPCCSLLYSKMLNIYLYNFYLK